MLKINEEINGYNIGLSGVNAKMEISVNSNVSGTDLDHIWRAWKIIVDVVKGYGKKEKEE